MGKDQSNPSREERLAAKLRENLRRRKAQGRAHTGRESRPDGEAEQPPLPKGSADS